MSSDKKELTTTQAALAGFGAAVVLGVSLKVVKHFWRRSKCKGKAAAAAAAAAASTATAADVKSESGPKVLPSVVTAPQAFTQHLKYIKFSPSQEALYKEIAVHQYARMSGSPDESVFLAWLAATTNAKRVIEVGVFMGATTLALAQALPHDGRIVALDTSKEFTDFGVRHWKAAGVDNKIDLRLAPAEESLKQLIAGGGEGTFDLAFIDANKTGYDAYYELCLRLVRRGGIIAVDNVYWHGAICEMSNTEEDTVAIRKINEKIANDKRVSFTTLSIADGLTLATKL